MRVWGVEYTIKIDADKWDKRWTGPCSIHCMSFKDKVDIEIFVGRPMFFRTRRLAREEAKKLTKDWVKYRAIPIKLKWRKAGG